MKPTDYLGPTTAHLECRVAGCEAAFDVPIIYRLEYETTLPGLADLEGVELGRPLRSLMNVSVVLDVDATLAGEYPLRAHLDGHATNGAPPVVEPPAWPEVEWCDGGGSCEHDACLSYADEVARDETRAAADCDADCERCGA
jgi:hypothetical protein